MGTELLKSKPTINLKPGLHDLGTESDCTAWLVQNEREEKGAGPPDKSHRGERNGLSSGEKSGVGGSGRGVGWVRGQEEFASHGPVRSESAHPVFL